MELFTIDDEVRVWLDGGIHIRALTPEGDPVELSSTQARRLARALDRLADAYDED